MLNIYLEEKNIAPDGYTNKDLESKVFFPEVSIQDFPIRGQKVALCIKRRRWTVKTTREIIETKGQPAQSLYRYKFYTCGSV
ncbi:hypothetical protein [Pedobacter sp. V48]|uniref:ISAon1 family transposase N-terminal region protein n=1 Tax=Pedobacter sp. V48 TaxID=509635 RepID=UPI0003E50912|nr:hypothetical protein [Pedobacter sp. V48]ETZ21420.1 hypothetical protein N824_28535 [Pedobacter sp. V48]